MEEAKESRHRFRFSLRTLFVLVTAGCIWLGWQISIVHERRVMLRLFDAYGVAYEVSDHPIQRRKVPGWRIWLGDTRVSYIDLDYQASNPEFEHEKVGRIFPEAGITSITRASDP